VGLTFQSARVSAETRVSVAPLMNSAVSLLYAWQAAARVVGAPIAVANALFIAAAAVWALTCVLYFRQGWRLVLADLRDSAFSPFAPIALIIPMLLGAALHPYAAESGRVIVVVFLAGTVLIGGWLTGQWMTGDIDPARFHPGYFLPTVAGGFIGAAAAAHVGLRSVAEAAFGIALVCWLLLGSVLLNRLFFRGRLPAALVPTLAIEAAPPAVGGIAYLALSGPLVGTSILGGYTLLMALVQVRLFPMYRRLRFGLSFWAFTFAYAAVATYALDWLGLKHPAGYQVYAGVLLALITGFVGAIAVRGLTLAVSTRPAPPAPRYPSEVTSPAPVRRPGSP
jgi:tellurite resistance protein